MSTPKSTTIADLTATLRDAIEQGDEQRLTSLYSDDATLEIFDRNRPPSKPTILSGRSAIGAYYHDVCSRAMTHVVEQAIAGPDGIAFTEACRYATGERVLSANLLTVRADAITHHTLVQAWDE